MTFKTAIVAGLLMVHKNKKSIASLQKISGTDLRLDSHGNLVLPHGVVMGGTTLTAASTLVV